MVARLQELVNANARRRAAQKAARKAPTKKRVAKPLPAPRAGAREEKIVKPRQTEAETHAPPRIAVERIDVAEALRILENFNTNNRSVRDSRVKQYADMMAAGEWNLSNDMIVLSWPVGERKEPLLLNGQHRLWAVIQSQTEQPFVVMRHADPEWQENMDTGATRTASERWGLRGDMGKVSAREVAVGRFLAGQRGKLFTNDQQREFFNMHRDAIRFACQHIKPGMRGISHTAVLAVVARGYYHAEQSELARFCEVLSTNLPQGEGCTPIFMLRKHLTDKAGMGNFGRADSYQRAQRALKAFLDGESPSKLFAAEKELFPLPEEK